jgi:hypothetical protein
MHRLRLRYTRCFVPSTGLASGAQSTANLDFDSSVQRMVGFGSTLAWPPALSGSQADPLFSRRINSNSVSPFSASPSVRTRSARVSPKDVVSRARRPHCRTNPVNE